MVAILLATWPAGAWAQSALPDPLNPGANWTVSAFAEQRDGKILVGGRFKVFGGQSRTNIARLNADGTLDDEFKPAAEENVLTLVIQPDEKILVGGSFKTLCGQPRTNIARLNPDGTLDSSFNPSANGSVWALALQSDGQIVVGGWFTTLCGQTRNYIGRLNADGTLDPQFDPGANNNVRSVVLHPDGRILAGGDFTIMAGQPRSQIARLNREGMLDLAFNPGANDTVRAIALQADGRILVTGEFSELAGQARPALGRLHDDGTLDTTFNPQPNAVVQVPVVQADGKILVGGYFTTLGGQPRTNLSRLNPDGTLDETFNPVAGTSGGRVMALAVQANGMILVGGDFSSLGGLARTNIGRLNNNVPATQSLSFDDSMITWMRGGASPEVWRTTFEYSIDSVMWTELGIGSRIPGGWQLQPVPFSSNATIRARGYITGGDHNGSGWFVEAFWPSAPQTRPVISLNDGSFGIRSNRFGFNITGMNNRTAIVECASILVSTNLSQWIPVQTNEVRGDWLYFSDPDWAEIPRRFYRVRIAD